MHESYQSAACWTLAQGRTLHRATPQARLLRVRSGHLWATLDARRRDNALPADCLLQAGQELLLRAGDGVVIEALADSAFEWLDPA